MVSGFKNILFGGEGLFLASLTGPGHVWLQSMPIMNLAEEISWYRDPPPKEKALNLKTCMRSRKGARVYVRT